MESLLLVGGRRRRGDSNIVVHGERETEFLKRSNL